MILTLPLLPLKPTSLRYDSTTFHTALGTSKSTIRRLIGRLERLYRAFGGLGHLTDLSA